MRFNIGTPDRIVRLLLAAGLAALAIFSGLPLFAEPLWFWGALAAAAVLAITAIVRFCPLYLPFGISTSRDS